MRRILASTIKGGQSLAAALILNLACGMPPAFAVAQFDPPEAELALLPPYCATVAGSAGHRKMDIEAKKWLQILGPEYYHIHHYCDAIWHWNLAQRTFTHDRIAYLKRALGGIEYVQARARPDFPLNAEMAYLKGEVLMAMGNERKAVASFQSAIRLRPSYTPPYVALADHYVSIGNAPGAQKILAEGLKRVPDAEIFQERLSKLRTITR